jgi:hypothetical protein
MISNKKVVYNKVSCMVAPSSGAGAPVMCAERPSSLIVHGRSARITTSLPPVARKETTISIAISVIHRIKERHPPSVGKMAI